MSRWWWWCWWCCCLHGNSQWFSVLSQVHGSTEQEIREMHDEQANPQNAVVSTAGEAKHCGKWSYNTVCWTGWGFIVSLLYGVFTAIKQSWWLICNIDHYGLYARDVRWNSASELMFWVKTIGLNTSELIWTLIFFDLIWILRCFIFTLPFVLFYCSLFCCSPLCRTDGTQMCWKCSFLFLVLCEWRCFCFHLCVREIIGFHGAEEGQTHYPHPEHCYWTSLSVSSGNAGCGDDRFSLRVR